MSQRLVRRADGSGRVPAVEVMVTTGRIAEAIVEPLENPPVADLIREGDFYKMRTFDQHLFRLVRDDVVTFDEAMAASSNPHDLTVELKAAGIIA